MLRELLRRRAEAASVRQEITKDRLRALIPPILGKCDRQASLQGRCRFVSFAVDFLRFVQRDRDSGDESFVCQLLPAYGTGVAETTVEEVLPETIYVRRCVASAADQSCGITSALLMADEAESHLAWTRRKAWA